MPSKMRKCDMQSMAMKKSIELHQLEKQQPHNRKQIEQQQQKLTFPKMLDFSIVWQYWKKITTTDTSCEPETLKPKQNRWMH